MSLVVLITGRLIAEPEQRTGANKAFTLAKVSAATDDGDVLTSVIAFGVAAEQLGALSKGDTVALNGRAKLSTWTARDGAFKAGLSVTAESVLTVYHLRRKRQAMATTGQHPQGQTHGGFDDGASDFDEDHT